MEMIKTVGLHKSFGALHVLTGVNQTIQKGEVVSIIGPSGGGKSTFLRCLNLLEMPEQGQIFFEGTEITGNPAPGQPAPKRRKGAEPVDIDIHRQKMGMVFQNFNVFPHLTVAENITLAPVMLKRRPRPRPTTWPRSFSTGWACWKSTTSGRATSPAARNSGWPSSGPLPWNLM